jgi:regulatory protein
MPEITAIEPQKKKKDRVNIYLDGQFAFGLSFQQFADANLKVGQEITQDEINKLIKLSEFGKIFDKTLKFLSFRPRSKWEIENYLKNKKAGTEVENKVLAKLEKLGLVNDLEFANWWIENRLKFRPRGPVILKSELIKKGIDREIIDQILEKIDDQSQHELALKIAQKQAQKFKNLDKSKFFQKMAGFLGRRGFSWEITKAVIDSVLEKR